MASPLESAITLEDVFAMVTGKRVPLAPELAGYLSLEVAEKADSAGWGGGLVDPRSVYIADEGSVALVRPRGDRTAPSAVVGGDTEESIRGILGQLLEASGSSTPALSAVARRAPVGSLRGLMEDIEAALIPVNRAAGRRALARLAREVKRVTHGVGRNAPPPAGRGSDSGVRSSRPDDVASARRERDRADAPESRSRLPRVNPPPPSARPAAGQPSDFGVPDSLRGAAEVPPTPFPEPEKAIFDNPADVDSLLEQFSRSTTQGMDDVSRDLKDMVDIGATALPPAVQARGGFPPPRSNPPRSNPPPSQPPASYPPPTPLPPRSGPGAVPPSPDVDELLALTDDAAPAESARPAPARRTSSAPAPRFTGAAAPPTPMPEPPPPPPPSRGRAREATPKPPASAPAVDGRQLPTAQSLSVAEWARPKKKRTDYWIVIAILALLAGASATVWLFKPGFISGRTAEKVAEEKAANEALKQKMAAAQQAASCHSALDVTDVPTGAEVLIRVGQAPVDIPKLPVGTRLEFVATAEGYAPKRVVVPAEATWDTGPDTKPRFEAAVQLDHSNPKAKLGDPWPPGEPGSQVGGKGPPGTVHIVSTPRGAEIWMLAGQGPEALIEQLPCEQSLDVLVAGPTTFRKRLHAAVTDFAPRPGETSSKIAKLSAR
jgi:hypothetical protein